MAAPQPIENQQRSYEVFEKKHYMECTTPASPALPEPLKPKRNRSSEPQPFEGFTESPSVPCVSARPCLPKRGPRCYLLPCLRPTGARVRSPPLCTAVRTAVVTLVVG